MKKNILINFFIGIILIITINACAQDTLLASSIPISLSYDAGFYQTSRGGNLKNGCEGWATLTGNDEYIFASRCDAVRLEKLGLYANAALKYNKNEIVSRQISGSDEYIMIDYTDIRIQSLYGSTKNKADAFIILNENQEYIYYRAEGKKEQLKELNFLINELIAANNSVNQELRIDLSHGYLNVAENILNGNQMIIGETNTGTIVAIVIDKNGTYLGYIINK